MQWASTLSRDFFLANVFVWFHKNFSINFYNVSKSKKWPKIRKFRGFGPLKIEPMELRTRKKTFGASFILEQLVSMRVQKIFLFKSLVHFKIFRRNGVWRVTGVKLRNYFYIFREWIDGIFYAVSFKFRGHRVCLSWLILLGVNFTSWTNTVLLKGVIWILEPRWELFSKNWQASHGTLTYNLDYKKPPQRLKLGFG